MFAFRLAGAKVLQQNKVMKDSSRKVVYWSIKSTYDLVQYGLGATDKFKGTGVWSFIEFQKNKEPASDSKESKNADKSDKDSNKRN